MAEKDCSFLVKLSIDWESTTVLVDANMVEAMNSTVRDCSQQTSNVLTCSSKGETAPISNVVSDPLTANVPDNLGSEDSTSCSTQLPEDEDSNSMERWGKEATLLVIEEYQNRSCQVDRGKQTKKALWQEKAGCLKEKGYAYNADQVAGQWKSLIGANKKQKTITRKSSSSRKTFTYESRMDEIFANDPSITSVHVSTSRSSGKVDLDEDDAICKTSNKENKEKSRKRKSQGGEMLEVMKAFIEHQDERKKEEKEQRERFHWKK